MSENEHEAVATLLAPIRERVEAYASPTGTPGHHAPQDRARLLAALDAVLALHQPLEVFEYDHINGVWRIDADGEKILMFTLCHACTPASVTESIGDCEYAEDESGEVIYPCPTVAAMVAALEATK
jgi:hypothetical protein